MDLAKGAWEALMEKRREWEAQGVLHGEDFVTKLRGGQWTALHKGKVYDVVIGEAKKDVPSLWC